MMTPTEASMMKTVISQMIREHRMMNKFSNREVNESCMRELLQQTSLEADEQLHENWRFLIFSGNKKEIFSKELIQTAYTRKAKEKYPETLSHYYMKIPMHVLVIAKNSRTPAAENRKFNQVTSFIQALQRNAWKEKLGIVWKTNEYHWSKNAEDVFELKSGEEIKGTLHVGYLQDDDYFVQTGVKLESIS
ncbi:nitroreductase family protein [Alkalicoccus daliensis]|uniref:Nitroreductase family protein n=1 Tax=Alkalicoccus daliensis TaxID=745820 RepID=A0A1H0GYM4_9BACI|nr:nitroreductase family protein [Alkalicoccus daliensis]SDO11973.1 Nitroreductase family protein [Alkalicoccus daliensis]